MEDVFKTTSRRLRRQKVVFKTCLEDVLKTCLKDVFKAYCREAKVLLRISLSRKSKCVSNKSMFPKSISDETNANPKCINLNSIISIFVLF